MRRARWTCRGLSLLGVCALALGGCSNPDAPQASTVQGEAPIASPGEPQAPPPPSASSYAAVSVKRTPTEAISAFAVLYVNWTYRTLTREQRTLAEMSVGAARTAELQAAATSAADRTLRAARIANHGAVVAVARSQSHTGTWVIVTHEQTSGTGDYEGVPGAYHVTLARVATVPGGYAIAEWLPQS